MALIYNGTEINSLIYNGIATVGVWNGSVVWEPFHSDPYNPLGLPANTIRVKFSNDFTPDMGDTQTLVDATNNVWDIYKQSNDWSSLFYDMGSVLLEVLGANTSNITNMNKMFYNCNALTTITLFDTYNVTNMGLMFVWCISLLSVPLFDTSNVDDISFMFSNCSNVQSGALALYQQASTQAIPPSNHNMTFFNCGTDTQTGSAELAQIPEDWK